MLISIHAAQEGCDQQVPADADFDMAISIHAAQEGCDDDPSPAWNTSRYFNPRSPRGLRQAVVGFLGTEPRKFQSTQPKRAATDTWARVVNRVSDFNPRSPRGLRR